MTSTSTATWGQQEPFLMVLDALERLQWSVFPLDEDKRPPKMGGVYANGSPKRLGWKHLQTRLPTVKEVQFWQTTYCPSAWAVITGAISHLVILDFDGEAGRETCQRLGLNPHIRTGSEGFHVYFQHPGWHVPTLNGKSKQALGRQWPGLDIRGDGGYAAFCGSNSHGPYIWLRDPLPDDLSILPDELRAMLGLVRSSAREDPTNQTSASAPDIGFTPASASRMSFTQSILSKMPAHRLQLAKQLLTMALEQSAVGRNNAGFRLACGLRDNKYSWEQGEAMMREYVQCVSTLNSKGTLEPYTESEAMSSLASAYGKAGNGSDDSVDLPNIILTGAQIRDTVELSINAIVQQQIRDPWIFLRSSRLVNVARDEQMRPRIHEMGPAHVTGVLSRAANFYTTRVSSSDGERKVIYVPVAPPRDVSEQILAQLQLPGSLPFPSLQGITEVPILRPDGSICDQPGYDPETHLYYMPPTGSKTCRVPTNPTSQDVKAALELIWDGFGEFCYASEADRANTLALLMTPIIRPAITGDVPLAGIDACKAGSGKGILANSTAIIATGRSASILAPPSTEEEWGKCLTAILMEGQTVICIDNVIGRLQSAKLDGVLTSEVSQGRVLGQSATAHVFNLATWIATGNNLQLGGDLPRRSYWIRLDPKMSRPWTRQGFRHPHLIEWVRKRRMELVTAILTLIRAWYASGQPLAADLPSMATFGSWVQIIGSILAHVGVSGFLTNQTQHYEVSDETSTQWEIFLQAWHDTFGTNWVKTVDIIKLMNQQVAGQSSLQEYTSVDLVEALPERLQIALKDKPNSFKNRLSQELRKQIGTCYGDRNLHLESQPESHTKIALWRVVAGDGIDLRSNLQKENVSSQSKMMGDVTDLQADSQQENVSSQPKIMDPENRVIGVSEDNQKEKGVSQSNFAGHAGGSDPFLTRSQGEHQLLKEVIKNEYIREGWKSDPHDPHDPQMPKDRQEWEEFTP